jgi:hypothetical protein
MAKHDVIDLAARRAAKKAKAAREVVVDEMELEGYSIGYSEDGQHVAISFVSGELEHTFILSRADSRRLAKRVLVAVERARRKDN